MTLRRSLLWLLPITALGGLSLAAATRPKPLVEPGLQVAKNGIVLDEQTRQPIAGAYVVVRWLEQSRIGGKIEGQCLLRTVARTDEQGHYAIPSSNLTIAEHAETRYFWDAYAYAPGYAEARARSAHPRAEGSVNPGSQTLEPMALALASEHATPEQRLDTLVDTLSRFSCEPFAKQELNPVAEQIYAEGYAAACLPEPNGAARLLSRLRRERPGAEPCEQFRQASTMP
jgi:hypothetical protein